LSPSSIFNVVRFHGVRAAEEGPEAKRVFIGEDSWYWDLKPDYKFGEVMEL
jgi:hypothetical protein